MPIFIEVSTILTEVLLSAYLFERMFERKKPIYAVFIYYIIYGLAISFGTFFLSSVVLRIGFLALVSLVGNFIVYGCRIFPCIYITLLYYVTVLLADLMGGAALSMSHVTINIAMGGSERLVYNAMAKLINLILIQLIVMLFRRKKVSGLPYAGILLLFCQIFSAIVCYDCFVAMMEGKGSSAFLLAALCLLAINIVICFFLNVLQQYYEAQNEAIIAEKQKEVQLQYYQDMHTHQEETRALWHDIKKYFVAMKTMVDADHSAEAEACFRELQARFDQINQSVDVGNRIIDSILSRAVKYAQETGTKIQLDVWVGQELHIPSADLFIIIGNTLDNAIEACAELPQEKRHVHVVLRQTNEMLYYEVSNPCADNAKPKAGRVHGYGLKNVRGCVEKNGGTIDISTEENIYMVRIMLNV